MEYKDIPGFPGYKASTDGRIFSAWVREKGNNWIIGRGLKQLSPGRVTDGRLKVNLWRDGKRHYMFISRLILLTFVGPCPLGEEGCHEDGNPKNNNIENLRWGTKVSNEEDKIIHGTSNRGGCNGKAKLTEVNVKEIRTLWNGGGWPVKKLAQEFNTSVRNIRFIISNKSWQHIK